MLEEWKNTPNKGKHIGADFGSVKSIWRNKSLPSDS